MAVERPFRLRSRQPGLLVPRLRLGPQPVQSSLGLPQSCRPPCVPPRPCAPLPPPWLRRDGGPPRLCLPPQQLRAPRRPSWLRPPCVLLRPCAPLLPPWPRRDGGPPRLCLPPRQLRAPRRPSWLRPPCVLLRP